MPCVVSCEVHYGRVGDAEGNDGSGAKWRTPRFVLRVGYECARTRAHGSWTSQGSPNDSHKGFQSFV